VREVNAIIERQQAAYQNQDQQAIRRIESEVRAKYHFVPDLNKSALRNAAHILGQTPWEHYVSRPSNLAFHDLTQGKIMPPATSSLLGLGLKFIPKRRNSRRLLPFESFSR